MNPHPVFQEFRPFSGVVQSGFQVDFLGARTRCEFQAGAVARPTMHVQTVPPDVNEEYFEWIDILKSVVSAENSYIMIELGAGYGRWAVRAACAIRQYRPMPMKLIAVEAEPVHVRWLETHFRDNGLSPHEYRIIPGVVSDKMGAVLFYVGMPAGGKDAPNEWYGQAIAQSYETLERRGVGEYEGLDLVTHQSGWKSITVQSVTLNAILEDIERVDLIDLDVQGEELKVLTSAIEEVNRKVLRLHVGTHNHDIETGLRKLLSKNGWQCAADFQCLSINPTPWGPVRFVDGVQSWSNQRFNHA